MKDSTVPVVAMICITILLTVANNNGYNGLLLMFGLTIIGGIAGYGVKRLPDIMRRFLYGEETKDI